MMVHMCRGKCTREPLASPSTWHGKPGLAFCRLCEHAIKVNGRPRDCPCCGQRLAYRIRKVCASRR